MMCHAKKLCWKTRGDEIRLDMICDDELPHNGSHYGVIRGGVIQGDEIYYGEIRCGEIHYDEKGEFRCDRSTMMSSIAV